MANIIELIFKAIDAGATSTTRQVGETFKKEMAGIQSGADQLGKSGIILDQHGKTLVDLSQKNTQTAQSHLELGKDAAVAAGEVQKAGNSATETANKTDNLKNKNQSAEASYTTLAVAAGAAFYGIVRAMGDSIKASNTLNSALTGLESIAQGTGQNFDQVKAAAESLTKDGLMTMSEAANSLKNLLSRGFSLDEATTLMNRFKDSASFGRQSALGFGQAIEGATEGLKNENSVLVDNAGVTKNVSKMWEEYAKQHKKSVTDLTLAEKRQAEYNGIMKETQTQVGDAAKLTGTLSGAQAALGVETLKAQQAFGKALQPALLGIVEVLKPIITAVTTFIEKYPDLTATISISAAVILGAVFAISTLRLTMLTLVPALTILRGTFATTWAAALGPIGIIIAAVGVLGVAIYGLVKAHKSAAEAAAEQAAAEREAAQAMYDAKSREVQQTVDLITAKGEEIKDIEKQIADKRTQISNEAAKKRYDIEKKAYDERVKLVEALGDAIVEALKRKNDKQKEIDEKKQEDSYNTELKGLEKKKELALDQNEKLLKIDKRALEDERDQKLKSQEGIFNDLKDAAKKVYEEKKDALEEEQRLLEDSLWKQKHDFQKSLDDRLEALKDFQDATERTAEKEADARVRAVQDQIDALEKQTDFEDYEKRRQARLTKKSELEKTLLVTTNEADRVKIKKDIADIDADLLEAKLKYERNITKDHLREQIEQIRTAAANEKDIRKEQYEDQQKALQFQLETEMHDKETQFENERILMGKKFDALKTSYDDELTALADSNGDKVDEISKFYRRKEEDLGEHYKDLGKIIEENFVDEKKKLDDRNEELRGKINAHYKVLNEDARLQGIAAGIVQKGNQKAIVELLKEYYPEWQNAGKTMAEMLQKGLEKKKPAVQAVADALKAAATIDVPPREIDIKTGKAQEQVDDLVTKLGNLKTELSTLQSAKETLEQDAKELAINLEEAKKKEEALKKDQTPAKTKEQLEKERLDHASPNGGSSTPAKEKTPAQRKKEKQDHASPSGGSSSNAPAKTTDQLKKEKLGRLPGFAIGGEIPGPPDQPIPIMAHGGELVIPRSVKEFVNKIVPMKSRSSTSNSSNSSVSNLTVVVTGNSFSKDIDVERAVDRAVNKAIERLGIRVAKRVHA